MRKASGAVELFFAGKVGRRCDANCLVKLCEGTVSACGIVRCDVWYTQRPLRLWILWKSILWHRQKSTEIAERIFANDHLLQVILPGIGLGGAPREWSSRDGYEFAVAISLCVGFGGDHDVHLFARLPDGTSKFMGVEQHDVTTLLREMADGFTRTRPLRIDVDLIPALKIESVGLRKLQSHDQNFDSFHRGFTEWDSLDLLLPSAAESAHVCIVPNLRSPLALPFVLR